MEEIACPQCRMVNAASASFCSRCGAPLGGAQPAATPGASGWELATAGMSQPAPVASSKVLAKGDYAGWWQRLGASFLDGIFIALFFALVFGVIALLVWAVAPEALSETWDWFADESVGSTYYEEDVYGTDDMPSSTMALFGIAVITWLVGTVAWETWWTRSAHMGKPGQTIAGFRVVTATDPARLSTGRAFGRACAKLLYNIPQLGGLITLVTAFTIGLTDRKQSIHDMISGTACVRKRALERIGVGPDSDAAWTPPPPPPPPPSMHEHVAGAPNRGTTEGAPGSGPFV